MVTQPLKKPEFIYTSLHTEILDGKWPVGENLPNEIELARRFGCSPGTVNKAVALLAHDGLVVRKNRMGTRVISNTPKDRNSQTKLDAFAFIYPSEIHEGIWRTVKGFQDASRQAERRAVLLSSDGDFRKEVEFVSRLSEFDVRGSVVYPLLLSPQEQIRFSQVLLDVKFPVVLVEVNLLGLEIPSVTMDGYHAGYTTTRYLLEQGARQVGFLANYARIPSVRDRYLGYRFALEEAGLPISQNLVLLEPAMSPDFKNPIVESESLAELYLDYCLAGNSSAGVDAVVCVNDFIARGLTRVAARRGIAVPGKLKIIGMEDLGFATTEGELPLTTYRVPFEKTGAVAFDVLTRLVTEGLKAVPLENHVRGELILRKSA